MYRRYWYTTYSPGLFTAQTLLLPQHPYPVYFSSASKPRHFDAWLSSSGSHLRYRYTSSTRQIQGVTMTSNRQFSLSKSEGVKTLKLYPKSPKHTLCLWCWRTTDLKWVADKYQTSERSNECHTDEGWVTHIILRSAQELCDNVSSFKQKQFSSS